MYRLTVLFVSNTLLSILHDLASSFGMRHNHNLNGKQGLKGSSAAMIHILI